MPHSTKSKIVISVVVCTQNRADLLVDLLPTLCEQNLSTAFYEIIVVDNDSTDRTRLVVEDFCRNYDNVRYCMELQHGLSYARNRGWREAKGEYICYVDDDCKIPTHYLSTAKEIIAQNPDNVSLYKSGKDRIFGFFVGQCMKKTQGKGNPKIIQELLKKYLDN